ncbi:MAG: hypothetical protein H0X63_09930 [Flavobacteriales bacterium]|nr:hypothetical protein [Flavobacteriales bacterium]
MKSLNCELFKKSKLENEQLGSIGGGTCPTTYTLKTWCEEGHWYDDETPDIGDCHNQ